MSLVLDSLTSTIRQFIAQYIESLPQLEALLLVSGDPAREWTVEELRRVLYLPEDVAGALVAELERQGFVERLAAGDRLRYRVGRADVDATLQELARTYQERRVAVISEIYSRPNKKVQTFADAFRFRKEKPE